MSSIRASQGACRAQALQQASRGLTPDTASRPAGSLLPAYLGSAGSSSLRFQVAVAQL